jgi:tetratricopeptide (TPR) repeat protein
MRRFDVSLAVVAIALFVSSTAAFAETNITSMAAAAAAEEQAWARHVVDAYQEIQLQQQATLHAVQQAREEAAAANHALETARADAEAAAKRNQEALEARLKQIEEQLTTERQHELETMQSSHRFTLIIVSVFAGVGFCGMLLFALFLLRSMNRRAEFADAHPVGVPLGHGQPIAGALGTGDTHLVTADPAQQSSARFISTIERLEKRMNELETSSSDDLNPLPANGAAASETVSDSAAPLTEAAPASSARPGADRAARVALLLGKGQALLNLQQSDTALACFDEVTAIDPTNAEAFVKKGAALEKLGKLDEAIDCYDRAIALDASMTMAYLSKGGVFNRLERYGEALQCYEHALRAQQKAPVS